MINEPQEPSLDGQGRGRLGGMVERRALTGKSQGSSLSIKDHQGTENGNYMPAIYLQVLCSFFRVYVLLFKPDNDFFFFSFSSG